MSRYVVTLPHIGLIDSRRRQSFEQKRVKQSQFILYVEIGLKSARCTRNSSTPACSGVASMMLFGGMPALVLTCRRADRQMSRHVGCVSAFGGKCHDISRTWREPDLWQMSKKSHVILVRGKLVAGCNGRTGVQIKNSLVET